MSKRLAPGTANIAAGHKDCTPKNVPDKTCGTTTMPRIAVSACQACHACLVTTFPQAKMREVIMTAVKATHTAMTGTRRPGNCLAAAICIPQHNEQMKFRANARRTVKFGRVDKYWHDKQPRNLCARGNSLLLEIHALLGLSLREHAPPRVHAVFGLLLHVHAPEPVAAVVASANLSHDGII